MSKLVQFTFSKIATPAGMLLRYVFEGNISLDADAYTTEYDKLVFLVTSTNEAVQENALRLITNITLEGILDCSNGDNTNVIYRGKSGSLVSYTTITSNYIPYSLQNRKNTNACCMGAI